MSGHTPGPWHLHPSGRPNILGSWTVFHGAGEGPYNQICAAENIDDARLIAAAPDLLAAAEEIASPCLHLELCAYGDGHACDCGMDTLRAAIAKARGGAA